MSRSYLKGALMVIPFILMLLYTSHTPISLAALYVDTDKYTYYLGDLVTVIVSGATPGGHVNLQVNDPTGTPAYVDETIASSTGTATFKFKIPTTWSTGTYTVIVTDSSTGASTSTTFKVETAPPPIVGKVIIKVDKLEVEVGGLVTITVTVLDTNNEPMAGQRVYLYINDEVYSSKLTASNGKAIFMVTFNVPGYYDVYAKSDTVKSDVVTIYVYRLPPKVSRIDLTVNATEIDAGDSVLLTATVYDQYDEPMANVQVDLYINDSYYTTATTSSEGEATFIVTLKEEGTYEFYAKSDTVKSNSVFVIVRPPPPPKPRVTVVDISVDKTEVKVGEPVKVSVLVLDQFNEPMANILVKLYVNGALYAWDRTNANGKVFFNVVLEEAGTYVLQAEAEGVRSSEVSVLVSLPPRPIIEQYLIYLIYIVLPLILVVIVVLVIYYKRWKR